MSILQFPSIARASPGHDAVVLEAEADHRIANNLALIIGLLRLRARDVTRRSGKMDRQEVAVLLTDVAARVETVARLHRMLSQSHRNTPVDLGVYLRELGTSLIQALSPAARLDVASDTCVLSPDQVLTLGMLMSEAITNAVKYAHPTGVPVHIKITCERMAPGRLTIDIADDGIGLPENFDPKSDGSLGLRMMRSLASQLGGILRFDSNALGTRMQLEMPVPDALPA
jgi:two-component sensor histidine kinase